MEGKEGKAVKATSSARRGGGARRGRGTV